jgi:hypothetical protein
MRRPGVNSVVTGDGVAGDKVDTTYGGLRSPGLARTGENGSVNSLAGLRPRELYRGQGNDRGSIWGGSR